MSRFLIRRPSIFLLTLIAMCGLHVPASAAVLRSEQSALSLVRFPDPSHRALRHLLLSERARPVWTSPHGWPNAGGSGWSDSSNTSCVDDSRSYCMDRIPISSRPTSSAASSAKGTGGVTEPLRRRIVLPLAGPLADTDHVIGHELGARLSVRHDRPVPTTRRVGPAPIACRCGSSREWPSTSRFGPVDSNTALWVRDAARQEKLADHQGPEQPEVLSVPVGSGTLGLHRRTMGRWGRRRAAADGGRPPAISMPPFEHVLGVKSNDLSAEWHASIQRTVRRRAGRRHPRRSHRASR
jgi:hypothetical protein